MVKAMGWQERDWAKLTDDELGTVYRGGAPVRLPDSRVRVWAAVALLTLAVGGFAYTQLPATTPLVAPQARDVAAPQARELAGLPGTNRAVEPDFPGGINTVCTDAAFDAAAQRWSCLSWAVNTNHVRVVEPPPYGGPCTHIVIDRDGQPRWLCLETRPVSPEELPAVPMPGLRA
jgi:hypothetical protein